MSVRFVLDTNVLSEPVKPTPDAEVMRHLERRADQLATVAPVWNELIFGCQRLPQSKRRRALERYLINSVQAALPILPYDARAADWHGRERARLAALGETPPFVDGQIASIAQVRGLVLVTRNVSDFARFADLMIEDWSS